MRVFMKNVILIISMQLVISKSSPGCPLYTWQCNNGQCIQSEDLCDGNYDCDDKSDETIEECLLRPCPIYAFQCAYGACITGAFKCNGVVDCVDGSDETRYLCLPKQNYEKDMQGSCRVPNSMQCKSSECISSERLCDGRIDCDDGSDETVEVCSFLTCPEYSFRCGYGACITGTSACDGVKDCRDGSDEIASICSNITSDALATVRPETATSTTARPDIYNTTTKYSSTTETSTISDNHCSTSTLMRGISTVPRCYYQNKSVSCYQAIQSGTIANFTCAPGYKEKHTKKQFSTSKCDVDGEWTHSKMKCVPDCGTLTETQKEKTPNPWEVTILRRDYAPIYMPICSGVIVSPKVVLTAAYCFASYKGAYYTDHIFYNLIPGFYNESYSEGDNMDTEVFNVSSISIKSVHRTQDLAVLVLVNYFTFSQNLKPICLPMAQSNVFSFYKEDHLNIGRPIIRDMTKNYLEYLIAGLEHKMNGRTTLTYVNIYHFIPFINRAIKIYDFLL